MARKAFMLNRAFVAVVAASLPATSEAQRDLYRYRVEWIQSDTGSPTAVADDGTFVSNRLLCRPRRVPLDLDAMLPRFWSWYSSGRITGLSNNGDVVGSVWMPSSPMLVDGFRFNPIRGWEMLRPSLPSPAWSYETRYWYTSSGGEYAVGDLWLSPFGRRDMIIVHDGNITRVRSNTVTAASDVRIDVAGVSRTGTILFKQTESGASSFWRVRRAGGRYINLPFDPASRASISSDSVVLGVLPSGPSALWVAATSSACRPPMQESQ